jgi:hypothetical protein
MMLDRTATEGFVDNTAQAGVIRLVGGQHAVGERPESTRHPPLHSGGHAVAA